MRAMRAGLRCGRQQAWRRWRRAGGGTAAQAAEAGRRPGRTARASRLQRAARRRGRLPATTRRSAGSPSSAPGRSYSTRPARRPRSLFDKSVQRARGPGRSRRSRAPTRVAAALARHRRPGRRPTDARLVDRRDARQPARLGGLATTTAGPISDWLVTVSAPSRRRDRQGTTCFAAPPAPRTSSSRTPSSRTTATTASRTAGDRDSGTLTSLRPQTVSLQDLADGQTCLKGDWASVTFSRQAKQGLQGLPRLGQHQAREQPLRGADGLPPHRPRPSSTSRPSTLDPINDERQNVIANSFPDDNSFYLPGADEIQLGTRRRRRRRGRRRDRPRVRARGPGRPEPGACRTGGNQAGAMGEGFGDYLAAAYSTEMAGFDPEWTPCIMEWDATSYDDDSTAAARHLPAPRRRPDAAAEQQRTSAGRSPGHPLHRPGLVERPARPAHRAGRRRRQRQRRSTPSCSLALRCFLTNPTFEEAARRDPRRRRRDLRRRLTACSSRTEFDDRELRPPSWPPARGRPGKSWARRIKGVDPAGP